MTFLTHKLTPSPHTHTHIHPSPLRNTCTITYKYHVPSKQCGKNPQERTNLLFVVMYNVAGRSILITPFLYTTCCVRFESASQINEFETEFAAVIDIEIAAIRFCCEIQLMLATRSSIGVGVKQSLLYRFFF